MFTLPSPKAEGVREGSRVRTIQVGPKAGQIAPQNYFQECGDRNQDKLESSPHTRNQQDQALAFGLRHHLQQRVRFD